MFDLWKKMHFDDILAGDVGEFGAFQKKIYFL